MPRSPRLAAAVQWFVFSYQLTMVLLVSVALRESAPATGLETVPAMAVAAVAAGVGYTRASADGGGDTHARRVESVLAFSVFALVASFLTSVFSALVYWPVKAALQLPRGSLLVVTSIDVPLAAVAALVLAYGLDVRWLYDAASEHTNPA